MAGLLCPLCSGTSKEYHSMKQREFLQCSVCFSVFTHPDHYLMAAEEQAQYECHNNNPEDVRYQNFVSPVTNAILNDFKPTDKGLDFGSGTGSPIVKVLEDNKYSIGQYDLFFHNNQGMLKQQYNYIACSEVAEHFKQPYNEFTLLKSLLSPGGRLYLMTDMFDENRDFATWYYKTDPTHVFLYHKNAFRWIQKEFGFSQLTIDKRLIVLGV
jgi:hypothetical protein